MCSKWCAFVAHHINIHHDKKLVVAALNLMSAFQFFCMYPLSCHYSTSTLPREVTGALYRPPCCPSLSVRVSSMCSTTHWQIHWKSCTFFIPISPHNILGPLYLVLAYRNAMYKCLSPTRSFVSSDQFVPLK